MNIIPQQYNATVNHNLVWNKGLWLQLTELGYNYLPKWKCSCSTFSLRQTSALSPVCHLSCHCIYSHASQLLNEPFNGRARLRRQVRFLLPAFHIGGDGWGRWKKVASGFGRTLMTLGRSLNSVVSVSSIANQGEWWQLKMDVQHKWSWTLVGIVKWDPESFVRALLYISLWL